MVEDRFLGSAISRGGDFVAIDIDNLVLFFFIYCYFCGYGCGYLVFMESEANTRINVRHPFQALRSVKKGRLTAPIKNKMTC